MDNSNLAPFVVVSPQAINCAVQFGTFRICSKTLPLQILWSADKIWLPQNKIFLLESNFHIVQLYAIRYLNKRQYENYELFRT